MDKIVAGIDIGSTTAKCLLLNDKKEIIAFEKLLTSYDRNECGQLILEKALNAVNMTRENVEYMISTGYGRRSMDGVDDTLPEIICHATGTVFLIPTVRTILDIGGQDSKAIGIDEDGYIERFEMNDKCAAGTGRFFEVLAGKLLGTDIDELGRLSLEADNPPTISSMCTIFAETEIISMMSEGVSRKNIIAGMNYAVAKRVYSMAKRSLGNLKSDIVFTGGVANSPGMVKAFEDLINKPVLTLDNPQITAALGAALAAYDVVNKK
ncbi:MAG: acyl-CoA dehydratase activase [Sedimentibacter sp.]